MKKIKNNNKRDEMQCFENDISDLYNFSPSFFCRMGGTGDILLTFKKCQFELFVCDCLCECVLCVCVCVRE